MEILAEGKTKRIIPVVLIYSKDDVTAGDGNRQIKLQDKGRFANETTCNVFEFLKTQFIPMAYLGRFNELAFIAEELKMLPLEFVARRVAWGSFMDRAEDGVKKGDRFETVVTEMFLKDDSRHDPLIVYSEERGQYLLYDAHKTLSSGEIGVFDPESIGYTLADFRALELKLKSLTAEIFIALEGELLKQDVMLVDFKVEFGVDSAGKVKLGDVIDADSWRAWIGGDPEQGIDKQYFRDNPDFNSDHLEKLYAKYRQATEITSRFTGLDLSEVDLGFQIRPA